MIGTRGVPARYGGLETLPSGRWAGAWPATRLSSSTAATLSRTLPYPTSTWGGIWSSCLGWSRTVPETSVLPQTIFTGTLPRSPHLRRAVPTLGCWRLLSSNNAAIPLPSLPAALRALRPRPGGHHVADGLVAPRWAPPAGGVDLLPRGSRGLPCATLDLESSYRRCTAFPGHCPIADSLGLRRRVRRPH